MDRYQRVERPRQEAEPINENEIRITSQGLIRNYISYASTLLLEKQAEEIELKAMGQAVSKTVAIAEIIKKRIPGLHQNVSISSSSITDVWEPIEEGLVPLEMTRHVSMITITLSNKDLDKSSPGYQAPVFLEPRKQQYRGQQSQQQPQYLNQQPHQPRQAQYQVAEESYGRGGGRNVSRGRGWGGRGRGRGGYGSGGYRNNQGYNQGYGNNQGYDQGYGNNQRYNQGYGNQQFNQGYGNQRFNQGYGNNQRYNQGYENDEGYQENGGYQNYGRGGGGGGRGRGGYYRGAGYERGRGGGRGYTRGRGRMGGRGRGNQAE